MEISDIVLIVACVAFGYLYFTTDINTVQNQATFQEDTVKIASWNLQIFGITKANNDTLMKDYATILKQYDIIFVQEIRDDTGQSFTKLCNSLPGYSCFVSSRAGSTISKEQYGVIYKKEIPLVRSYDYNSEDNQVYFERPPIKAIFLVKNKSYEIYTIHTKPENVQYELVNLEKLVKSTRGVGEVIVLGDLNADCSYYKNDGTIFSDYRWIIDDDKDTTVGLTNCAYDRIIIDSIANQSFINYGIDKSTTKDLSDHYPIWIEMK